MYFGGKHHCSFWCSFFCARARSGSSKKDRSISPSFIFPIPFVGFGLKRTCGCSWYVCFGKYLCEITILEHLLLSLCCVFPLLFVLEMDYRSSQLGVTIPVLRGVSLRTLTLPTLIWQCHTVQGHTPSGNTQLTVKHPETMFQNIY